MPTGESLSLSKVGCLVGVLVWIMGVSSFERVELKRASFSCRGSFN